VPTSAATVEEYLRELPEERRTALEAVADTVRGHLPPGYEEGIQYGMISWYIPLERYPETYNGQPLAVASLASQKRHMALYLNCVYTDDDEASWFRARWSETGKKLDMGKSCVRFRKLEDLPLEVIGEAVERIPVEDYIGLYEASRSGGTARS